MANVKYQVVEFNPSTDQKKTGLIHSFTAKPVINSTLTNVEICDRIAAMSGFKAAECQAVIALFAEAVASELLESNAVVLADKKGNAVVTFRPNVNGSVSDDLIKKETTAAHAKDSSIAIRTVATEADVTPNRLSWNVSAQVGINFSKAFAQNKSAKKVKVGYTEVVEDTTTEDSSNNRTEV